MRLIGLAGWSGAGKTTLMTRLIPELARRGIGVSTLKHAHHAFDIDQPGKDSYAHRSAGAHQVLVASARRWALMTELRDAAEPSLQALLRRLDPVDLVIVGCIRRTRPSPRSRAMSRHRRPGCRTRIWTTSPRSPNSFSPRRSPCGTSWRAHR